MDFKMVTISSNFDRKNSTSFNKCMSKYNLKLKKSISRSKSNRSTKSKTVALLISVRLKLNVSVLGIHLLVRYAHKG